MDVKIIEKPLFFLGFFNLFKKALGSPWEYLGEPLGMPWEAPGDALGGLGDALECLGDALGGLGDTQEGLGDALGGPSWENLLERPPWKAQQGRFNVGGPRPLKSIFL